MGVLCNQYLERIILSLQILFRKSIPTLWLWWVTSRLSGCCLKFLGKGQSERLPLAWGRGASPGAGYPSPNRPASERASKAQTGRTRRVLKQGAQCVVMKRVFKNPNCSRPEAEAQPSGNHASAAPVTAKHRLQVSGIFTPLAPDQLIMQVLKQIQNHLEGCSQQIAEPIHRDSDLAGLGWGEDFTFPASSQVMLMLLAKESSWELLNAVNG